MTGHIQQRGPERWRIMVYVGRNEAGRQRFASETVHGGREAAEHARDTLAAAAVRLPARERRTARRGRLPLGPLMAVARCSAAELARLVDVDARQVTRWIAYGVTVWQADRLTVACGLHPGTVWPDWCQVPLTPGHEAGGWR